MRPPGLGKVAQLPHVFSEDDASQGLLLRLGSGPGPGPVDDPVATPGPRWGTHDFTEKHGDFP